MTRKTKALSGASQDAYFRRVLKTYPALSDEARERIVRRLRREIAHVRVRTDLAVEERGEAGESAGAADAVRASAAAVVPAIPVVAAPEGSATPSSTAPQEVHPEAPFDPFALNVIVMLRTEGKEATLSALSSIGDADNLKLLAREQRLSIDETLEAAEMLSAAIISAAERRMANRRAAAGAR